ncbi:MAG: aldo/keto reductase [Oscillospiraceae bacterium]|nr:aldo/keto reductase [Oscillospiraceae bacterium]
MSDLVFDTTKPRLGFGFMRMPAGPDGKKDLNAACAMVDEFLAAGFDYFDTAYIYEGSEKLLNESLVRRHPRDAYRVTTKLSINDFSTLEEGKAMFEESMKRLGLDYLDVCLIHALTGKGNEKAERIGVWDYIHELKASGRVRHIGFSFHDSAAALDAILTAHPETEVVQIQLNYIDWDDPHVDSRGCWETARRHGKPLIIMEPVKGGMLTGGDKRVAALLLKAAPDKSAASWALRFAASHEGIFTVLSGMSTIAQVRDNVATFRDFEPISEREQAVLDRAVELIREIPQYPCTECRYCVKNCPNRVAIPTIIRQYNYYLRFKPEEPGGTYKMLIKPGRRACDCIGCGTCEEHCPQKLPIREIMEKASALFDT